MKLFLIVAKVDEESEYMHTFLMPASDEQSAQDFVFNELVQGMDDEGKQSRTLDVDVSVLVGEYEGDDLLRIPAGVDWNLKNEIGEHDGSR